MQGTKYYNSILLLDISMRFQEVAWGSVCFPSSDLDTNLDFAVLQGTQVVGKRRLTENNGVEDRSTQDRCEPVMCADLRRNGGIPFVAE